jgi:hypothetical protein
MGRQRDAKDRHRQLVSQEAARVMAQEGVKDFKVAKRKAAQRLGLPSNGNLPGNAEVEAALRDYQRLFQAEALGQRLCELRKGAVEAMEFLQEFSPRLVGSVLRGTAGAHAGIGLHLFANTPEEVVLFLMERDIPYSSGERRFRVNGQGYASYPVYGFTAGEMEIELVVFPIDGLRHAPWSPVDGKPMRRADIREVEKLLVEDSLAEMFPA